MGYRGLTAEIPVGLTGLAGSKNQISVPPTALIITNNLTYESGTVEKEGGTAKYNTTAITGTPSVLAGHDWDHDGSTQRMVILTDAGDLLKDDGGGTFGTKLASGLTVSTTQPPVFVEGGKEAAASNRRLFIFSGGNQVQVLSADAATVSSFAGPTASTAPADWGSNFPTWGEVHKARLWGGGNNNDAHRAYYSTVSEHEDFLNGGSIAVYPGEGIRTVHGISFKGLLVVFKWPVGIYTIDTRDPTIANWRVDRISAQIGCPHAGLIEIVDDDIIFFDQGGNIRLLSSIDEFGNAGTEALSNFQNVQEWIRDNLTWENNGLWRMKYYQTKRELHIACTGIGATANDTRLVIDFNGAVLKFRSSTRDTPVSIWDRLASGAPRLVYGDNGGFVRRMDQTTREHDGGAYPGEFQTPHMDLSFVDPVLASKNKNFAFLTLVSEPEGNWDLAVDVIVDGQITSRVTFDLGNVGAALGSFTLGTSTLQGDRIQKQRRRISGSGQRISLAGSNSGNGQNFSVGSFLLDFTVGDESD